MSRKIWIISDTHYHHRNVIKYTGRPFDSIKEMDEALIANWNKVVKNTDWVYHLGDFALCGREEIGNLLSQLNGNKILVKGNHDGGSAQKYLDAGFKLVYENPVILDGFYILSHEPIFLSADMPYANIHGHIHQHKMDDLRYFNASVEHINYTPILFEKIKKSINENVDNLGKS